MAFDLDTVRRNFPGRQILYFDTLDSTMREAADLAAAGCPKGTTVVAGEQSAGIGRLGHSWHSEAGSGLYVSVVLRPEAPPSSLPPLTLALGLAAAEAIGRATGLACDLRWPNDVMLNERKVAGVLTSLEEPAVIAGIGINVNHVAFPPEIAKLATSLRMASGQPCSQEQLLIELLTAVDGFTRMLAIAGRRAILDLFARCSSYAKGKRVVVEQGGEVITGSTVGLDDSGFLLISTDGGTTETIWAGGVRAAGA
jgi:BirA family transcriptional regulator, biotin operon repressor / biotin---[acetyl-CoA-carboxylase] ligase